MRGHIHHNVFIEKIWITMPKLWLLPHLIWSIEIKYIKREYLMKVRGNFC